MKTRGPLRQPGSVRDLKENGGVTSQLPEPERPIAPANLAPIVRKIFDAIVDEAFAAGVPMKACDSHMFAMTAQYQHDFWDARSSAERTKIGRDLEKFYDVIGLHPKARLRMGIKGSKVSKSKTAQLLEMVK